MLLAASCLPRRGHAAHGLDRRLPRGREALPGPGGGLRAGHQVSLATPRPFEPDARRLGLGFAPTEGNPRQVLETEQGCVAGGRPPSAAWHTAAAGGGSPPGGPAAGRRDRRLPGRRGHHLRPWGFGGHERHGLASVGPPLIGYDAALPKAFSRSAGRRWVRLLLRRAALPWRNSRVIKLFGLGLMRSSGPMANPAAAVAVWLSPLG